MGNGSGNQIRAELLAFIARYTAENGYAPALKDMEQALGLSSRGHVSYHLRRLRNEGKVEWTPGHARTVRLTGQMTLP